MHGLFIFQTKLNSYVTSGDLGTVLSLSWCLYGQLIKFIPSSSIVFTNDGSIRLRLMHGVFPFLNLKKWCRSC